MAPWRPSKILTWLFGLAGPPPSTPAPPVVYVGWIRYHWTCWQAACSAPTFAECETRLRGLVPADVDGEILVLPTGLFPIGLPPADIDDKPDSK